MSKVKFDEVFLWVRRVGKCGKCGKRTRRVCKLWQTVNPFNLNVDGFPKTQFDILKELNAEFKVVVSRMLLCSGCEHELGQLNRQRREEVQS